MKAIASLLVVVLALAGLSGCGGSRQAKYEKTPVDNLIRDMANVQPYSIILYDMDASESGEYKHKYRILKEVNGQVKEEITPWYNVSERFFASNQDNMGMTIASKDSIGNVSKVPSPPGYDNYVGNPHYGQWVNQNGTSFWQFYGQYAFMRDMLGMGRTPIYRNYYSDYRNYRTSGRAYYGPVNSTGGYTYGTRGTYTSQNYSNNTWSQKPTTFKQNVRSRVQRSSQSASRTSRSSSRYSSGSSSSSRSRGGGFGK